MDPSRNNTPDMAADPASPEAPRGASDALKLPTDADLLRRAGHGEGGAFRELVERHGRYLFGIARSLTGNRAEDADDLMQETFVAVLGAAKKFRGDASVKTWLVSILVRQAALARRKQARFPRLGRDDDHNAAEPGPRQTTQSSGPASDAKIDLAKMLDVLSIEHRQVIVLRELEQMSYEEMAKALGVPRGTVESRLFRAREELKKKFKGY